MKFCIFKILILVIIVNQIAIVELKDIEKSNSDNNDSKVLNKYIFTNHVLNKGFSLFRDNHDVFANPSSMLGDGNIFKLNYDVSQMLESSSYKAEGINFLKVDENKRDTKFIRNYTYEEVDNAEKILFGDNDFPILTNNFFVNRAKSIEKLNEKYTVINCFEYLKLKINIDDKNTKFPFLSDKFITDSNDLFAKEVIKEYNDKNEFLTHANLYLKNYGTHYISEIKFGSKVCKIEEIMKKVKPDKSFDDEEADIFKSGSFNYIDGVKERVDTTNQHIYESGHCTFNFETNNFENCIEGFSKLAIIGYTLKPLYDLFDKASPKNLATKKGLKIEGPYLDKIKLNLNSLLKSLFISLDIRNAPVTDFYVMNNLKQGQKYNVCLKKRKLRPYENLKGSLYNSFYKIGTNLPVKVFSTDTIELEKNETDLATNGLDVGQKSSTFACLQKADLFDSFYGIYKFNTAFINKLYFRLMNKIEEGEEHYCKVFWVNAPAETKNSQDIIYTYLCVGLTSNILDPNIVTDIKVRKFSGDKCESNFSFNEKKYTCLCDYNLLKSTNSQTTFGKYLCYAKKITT